MSARTHSRLMFYLFFCVFFFVSFLHVPRGHFYEERSFSEIQTLIENNQNGVVYFSRNDCSECQELDKLLIKNDGKLQKDVYRIETRNDLNTKELREFLETEKIKKVPTFWSIDAKRVIKEQVILKQ